MFFEMLNNLINNVYKQVVQYDENDGFSNQTNELEKGQFRIILDHEPVLIKQSLIEQVSDHESDQPLAFERAQHSVMIALDYVSSIAQSQNADTEPVGDPYYLKQGKLRIILE